MAGLWPGEGAPALSPLPDLDDYWAGAAQADPGEPDAAALTIEEARRRGLLGEPPQ
jgi:hypothetical protein